MFPNIPLGILETVFLWIIKVLFECDNLNLTYASFLQILDITYNFFTISTAILFVCSLLWPILVCIHVCGNIPVCKCSMKRFIVPSNNQTSSSSGESCGSVAVGYKYQYLQGVPKKMVILSGFEFLTLGGVFLGVKINSKNSGTKKKY